MECKAIFFLTFIVNNISIYLVQFNSLELSPVEKAKYHQIEREGSIFVKEERAQTEYFVLNFKMSSNGLNVRIFLIQR